jgi:hypothetical protein
LSDLLYADFDDRTKWPQSDKMPEAFDHVKIMEFGKNPGLGVHTLHKRGITGMGVSIAIIDQPLLVDHQEYEDRIQLYEEINIHYGMKAQMHGAAVASIVVGKTVGVAPSASLYYIGSWTGDWGTGESGFTYNFHYYAQAIRRLIDINAQLPESKKIRVITMQIGWNESQIGYDDITDACMEAVTAGMFVISSSIDEIHGFHFHGLGRSPMNDPDLFESYEPGLFWEKYFYQSTEHVSRLLIPMDSRTTASPCGVSEYVFYRQGGWSWAMPYIAGMYALAVQAKPTITPDEFWPLALKTGKTITIQHEGKSYLLGPIIDPISLIDTLLSGSL